MILLLILMLINILHASQLAHLQDKRTVIKHPKATLALLQGGTYSLPLSKNIHQLVILSSSYRDQPICSISDPQIFISNSLIVKGHFYAFLQLD